MRRRTAGNCSRKVFVTPNEVREKSFTFKQFEQKKPQNYEKNKQVPGGDWSGNWAGANYLR
jgi:hypothetical protein